MIRVLVAAAAALALITACAHAPPETASRPPTAEHPSDHAGAMMATCPMGVPGAQVSSAAAEGGETLSFTSNEQVPELRSRVHSMVAFHNQHHPADGSHGGMMGGGTMPPSYASVVDTEDGANVLLTPTVPADLSQLQSSVRIRAHRMRLNGCGAAEQVHGS
jgi:hypothetical protein